MLNSHPHIWIGPENGVFQSAWRDLPALSASMDLPVDVLQKLYRKSCCLGAFVELSMNTSLAAHQKARWGVKSPSIVHMLDFVFHFFPNARFFHLVRDGRDVVCSLRHHPRYVLREGKKVPSNIVNSWQHCVERWTSNTEAGLRWRSDPRYYEVRYEALVMNPEKTLQDCMDWLGESYYPEQLEYHRTPVEMGIGAPHPGIEQAVHNQAIGRWKQEAPKEALQAFTSRSWELMALLGYQE